MHFELLSFLACPSCRCRFVEKVYSTQGDRIISATLTCPVCQIATPVVEGFPLFNEARPMGDIDQNFWLSQLEEKVTDPEGSYQDFLREKVSRGHSDAYAAFQPFNESTRALYPFIPLLRECLQPGDIILDTWCRTGWSGELLAGLFPEQRIVSIWEGNSNVLGYRGFAFWLGQGRRPENLDILFTHPDHALPIADNAVRIVHGLDSLHRYRHASYIPECLRVCQDDGVLIFPHIHLTNSQPEPFFERGCHQYHGQEWKAWLDRLLQGKPRSAWIFPEAGLFEAEQEFLLTDQSNTQHYNALVLIADEKYQGHTLQPCSHSPIAGDSKFLANPLVSMDLHQCRVNLDPDCLAGQASTMLERHPCYKERLEKVVGSALTSNEARFIWHAHQALDLQSIASRMEIPQADAMEIAARLCRRELLHSVAVSPSMMELQNFFAFVKLPKSKPSSFSDLWQAAIRQYGQRPVLHWLEDDSELQADDVVYLVDAIRHQLVAEKLVAGSRILISSYHHPEALLLCWAAWLQGVATVIVDAALPLEEIARLQKRSKTELCFTDNAGLSLLISCPCIVLDSEDVPPKASFSGWLEASLDGSPPTPFASPDAIAVILFTSGSTGLPKGVMLSQRALCNSGLAMAEAHGWDNEAILSLGPLSMMSGLRNPAVASLISGSTILVPGHSTNQHPLQAWQQASDAGATVITAVPAWLSGIMRVVDRLDKAPKLKQVLLTGTSLSCERQKLARESLNVLIGDYYGLTETGGICTAALSDEDTGTLGKPVNNALLHILDGQGRPVGPAETGRLSVHSDQLMNGYLDDPNGTKRILRLGWLLTGDLAHWDSEGRLLLDGREDELLKLRNGTRFHPGELESIMVGLAEVDSAAVLLTGENLDIVALLVTTADLETVREKLTGKVPDYLMPSQMIIVPDLPINSNGKLVRSELENIFKLNLESSTT